MWNFSIKSLGVFLVAGLIVAGRSPFAAEPVTTPSERTKADVVVVSMRPVVETDLRVIRLVDVATVTGGDTVLRERIKQLDLEGGLSPGESVTVLPPQVEFRLRLAGIDIEQVSIRGQGVRITSRRSTLPREPEVVTSAGTVAGNRTRPFILRRDFTSISVDEGPLEREMIQAAKTCLLNKLPWPAENVDIRLSQPMSAEVHQVGSAAGYECSAELRTAGPAVGRVLVRVIAEAPQKPAYDAVLALDVRHFDKVALTTRTIDRGHVIAASDVYVDRQDVTELSDYCSSTSELIGMTAKRSIRALLPVRMSDVESQNRTENSVLIKRREQVKMIARIGALNVTATGESLQDGRLGETIRLKNLDSNANVQGRVTGPGEVEIAF